MFQRLKEAIDSRIAEEQARQRAAAQSASPSLSGSSAVRSSLSGNISPSKRQRPGQKAELLPDKVPEPHEFDSDFAVGDESANNGAPDDNSPERSGEREQLGPGDVNTTVPNISIATGNGDASQPTHQSGELPTELRMKLRKLERLEGRYRELLGAYRIAHARVQTIEPFEASLRENTPLTSIGDPGAFVEYLNHLTLKSDMVLNELKRVAAERDQYRNKFDGSEKEIQALKAEVSMLKEQVRGSDPAAEQPASSQESHHLPNGTDSVNPIALGSVTSVKSPPPSTSSRIPNLPLFSPRSTAVRLPYGEEESREEFFSYDNELPRLEAQLRERETEIADLKKEVSILQRDLSVARESTESMVQSLESATRELHALRDTNEKHESARSGLLLKVEGLEQEVSGLSSSRAKFDQDNATLESQISQMKVMLEEKESILSSVSRAEEERKTQLAVLGREASELREKFAEKDATVKDLEDSLAMALSGKRQHTQQSRLESASQKQIGILNNIMDSLRSQLKTAEGEIRDLKEVKRKAEIEINDLLELKAHNDGQEEARSKLTDEAVGKYVAQMAEQPSTRYFGFVNDEEFSLSGDTQNALRQLSQKLKSTRPELYEALISPEKSNEEYMAPSEASPMPHGTASRTKKKKKKKQKGGKCHVSESTIDDQPAKVTETLNEAEDDFRRPKVLIGTTHEHLLQQIKDLERQIQEKDITIDRLFIRLKDQDSLNEEIETLRDDLLHQGEGHVEAREALNVARHEKSALEEGLAAIEKELTDLKAQYESSSAESKRTNDSLLSELEFLKTECSGLRTNLAAAEQLASLRFRDITDLRAALSGGQQELKSLRSEVEELRTSRVDLKNKIAELSRLESRHNDLQADMKNLGRKIGDKDTEIKDLRQKLVDDSSARSKVEDDLRAATSQLQDAQATKDAALDSQRRTSDELSKVKADYNTSETKIRELEEEMGKQVNVIEKLKEEISLKTSLHNSIEAILTGLRDEMLELSTQAREASSRADSLEEELSQAQRMLSERSREGETMRHLLADVEGRTSTKIREMKERMETAIAERDMVEDEASTNSRRMVREMEGLRNMAKEAARSLSALEDEKEQLERSHRDLKRRRDELEADGERARAEVAEVQAAMQQMREALDQRDRESIELERQATDARRMLGEVQGKVAQLQETNKTLTEELKSIQQQRRSLRPSGGVDSRIQQPRRSLDSTGHDPHSHPRDDHLLGSPAYPGDKISGSRSSMSTVPHTSTIDYVYLKNVLLQFLEQKDKNHQKQLVPVLGMLLKFDPKDEQKWMAAITSR